MKRASIFTRASSSGSDTSTSSSDLTDASDDSHTSSDRNVEAVIEIYATSVPRATLSKHDKALGLSKRAVDRLTEALIAARLALLRKKWTALQAALKQLDIALQTISNEKLLSYRLPIVARLYSDAILALDGASVNKRSLTSDDARALATLRQKLPKHIQDSPWREAVRLGIATDDPRPQWLDSPQIGRNAEAALLDSIELCFLSGSDLICLSNLFLSKLESTLGKVEQIFAFFASFGDLPCQQQAIKRIDLSSNMLTEFPAWLPVAFSHIKELDLRRNHLTILSPSIRLFEELEALHFDRRASTNVLPLLSKAVTLRDSPATSNAELFDRVPSLALLALRVLSASNNEAVEDLPVHLRYDPFDGSYHCASCKRRILLKDKHWLHAPLAERLTLFNPPYDPAHMQDHSQTSCVVGGPEWRFCAPCLYAHCCTFDCSCFMCKLDRADSKAGKAVRWARRREVAYAEDEKESSSRANDGYT